MSLSELEYFQHEDSQCDVGGGNDEMTCAICLNAIDPLELAIVKGCFHEYCACCILKWAACKPDPAWCPKCKTPFSYLYLHRQLDGTVSDYPLEESVCLLKVAPWFVEHVRETDKGKLLSGTSALAAPPGEEAYDDEEDYFDGDDDEDEDFYLSRGSGRPRVVLGNRRLGENGFMRSGRMYARPVPPVPTSVRGKGGSNRKGGAQQNSGSSSNSGNNPGASSGAGSSSGGGGTSSVGGAGSSRAAGPSGSSGGADAAGPGPSSAGRSSGAGATSNTPPNAANNSGAGSGGKQGRRAKRSVRRAAYDLDLDDEYAY